MQDSVKQTDMYQLLVETLDAHERKQFDIYLDHALELLGEDFYVIKAKRKAWQEYLYSLDSLNAESSLLALKILFGLLYRVRILRDREELRDLLLQKQEDYFLSSNVSQKKRIVFGIEVYKKWPNDLNTKFRHYFTNILEKLFIEEAKYDPHYILEQFDRLDDNFSQYRSYIFGFGMSNPVTMLEFAKAVQNERPVLLVNALSSFLGHYNINRMDKKNIDSNRIKESSLELYSLIVNNNFSEGTNLEKNLQYLIRYAYMDEPWYTDLCVRLWEIEAQKIEIDNESLKNYFLIAVNCHKNTELTKKVYEDFERWKSSYKIFDLAEHKVFVEFFKQIDSLFSDSLHEVYSDLRNINLLPTVKREIIDDLENTCWEMIEWVYQRDKKLYFVLLKEFAKLGSLGRNISRRIALARQASELFIKEFEILVKDNIDLGAEIIGILLQSSSSRIKELNFISNILDRVYFMLEDISPENARAELDKVIEKEKEFYRHYDRGGPSYWRPKRQVNNWTNSKPIVKKKEIESLQVRIEKILGDDNAHMYSNRLHKLNTETCMDIVKVLKEALNKDKEVILHVCKALSRHDDYFIRMEIAQYFKTPVEILVNLSDDYVPFVRKCVASNSKTPSEILDKLSKDEGRTTRALIKEQIERFDALKGSKSLSKSLKLLNTSVNIKIKYEYSIFGKKVKFENVGKDIRYKVSGNPNAATHTLRQLVDDDEWIVSDMAKKCLKKRGVEI